MATLLLLMLLSMVNLAFGGIANGKRDVVEQPSCAATTVTVVSVQNSIQTEVRTETLISTVTVEPSQVTIALEAPDAISKEIESAISIESQQIEINSQLAPINPLTSTRPHVAPTPKTFTRPVELPVVHASKTTASDGKVLSSDIYYLAQSNETTQMLTSLIPHSTIALFTTTITISPIDRATASPSIRVGFTRITRTRTEAVTVTLVQPQATGSPNGVFPGMAYAGWNASIVNATVANAVAGTNSGIYPTAALPVNGTSAANYTRAANETSAIVTIRMDSTIVLVTAPPASYALPTGASASTADFDFPSAAGPASYGMKRDLGDMRRRELCDWVTATMRGVEASWRNPWNGVKTIDCNTYVSTQVPTQVQTTPVDTTSSSGFTTIVVPSSLRPTLLTSDDTTPTQTVAEPTATNACGVPRDFNLDFEHLPAFAPANDNTAPFPPVPNPYQKLYFSSDWSIVPPPTIPVKPQDGQRMAVYVPSVESKGLEGRLFPPGGFGAGPNRYINAYYFNARSLYTFCDNGSEDLNNVCTIVATGYRVDPDTHVEELKATQQFIQPPCPAYRNCATQQIFLNSDFTGLSTLAFEAKVGAKDKMLFIDTVAMGWWNNTCAASQLRAARGR